MTRWAISSTLSSSYLKKAERHTYNCNYQLTVNGWKAVGTGTTPENLAFLNSKKFQIEGFRPPSEL